MTIRKLATTSPSSLASKILVVPSEVVEVVPVDPVDPAVVEMVVPVSGLTMNTSSRSDADKISTTSEVPGIARVNGRGETQCLTKPGATVSTVGSIGVAAPVVWMSSLAILNDGPGE